VPPKKLRCLNIWCFVALYVCGNNRWPQNLWVLKKKPRNEYHQRWHNVSVSINFVSRFL
jgi:hypothetical protein